MFDARISGVVGSSVEAKYNSDPKWCCLLSRFLTLYDTRSEGRVDCPVSTVISVKYSTIFCVTLEIGFGTDVTGQCSESVYLSNF